MNSLLKEWENEEPNNPEMKIAFFNYFMRLESSSQTTMGQMDDGKYGLFNKVKYNGGNVKIAVSYLDNALIYSPDRLDIYFGKCSALMKVYNFREVAVTVYKMLYRSIQNSNKWYWANNVSFESKRWSGEEAIFSTINDYLPVMFNFFDSSKNDIKNIIETVIKLYPNNIIGLNHAARYYDLTGNFKKAIELLLKSHQIDPTDYVTLGNMANLSERNYDYKNARKYYLKLKQLNIPEATEFGNEGIKRIDRFWPYNPIFWK